VERADALATELRLAAERLVAANGINELTRAEADRIPTIISAEGWQACAKRVSPTDRQPRLTPSRD